MEPKMYRSVLRSAIFLPLTSRCATAATLALKDTARQLKTLLAPAIVVLLLLGAGKLFAQQPPGDPGWSQNDSYNGQYAPTQQSDYGQQPEAQQPYPDSGQAYPSQEYSQALTPAQPLNAS